MGVVSKYTLTYKVDDDIYILLNALTGAIDIADEEPIKVLERIKKGEKYMGDLYYYLKERGYIFDSPAEEIDLLKDHLRRWKINAMESPITFVVGVTTQCNFSCKYCFQQYMQKRKHEEFWNNRKLSSLFDAMDKIMRENMKEKANLALFGGEPLLLSNKNYIIQILERAEERGFNLDDIITNGFYLSEYISLIKKHNIRHVQVTLDGTEKIHNFLRPTKEGKDTFSKIVNGIDRALKSSIHITLRTNVNGYNIHNLPALARYIKQMGWDRYPYFGAQLGLVYPYGFKSNQFPYLSEAEALKLVLDMYDKYPEMRIFSLSGWDIVENILSSLRNKKPFKQKFAYCGANTTTYGFDPDGKIYACFDAVGMKEMAIGEYYPSYYIDKIIENKWRTTVFEKEHCKNCKYALLCGGGCIFHGILSGKGFSDPLCPQVEESLKILLTWYYKNNKDTLLGKR